MIGGGPSLRQYLQQVPFNIVHADILMLAKKKPSWLKPKDYIWTNEQKTIAESLGVKPTEIRRLLVQNYHLKTDGSLPLPECTTESLQL